VNTIVVVDSEPIAIEGLRALLKPVDDLRVIAAAGSLKGGMEAVLALRPSVVMLDKAFGIHAVMGFLNELRPMGGRVSGIVWSFALSESETLRFLQAGASGVIRKTVSLEVLLTCLRSVASGKSWAEGEKVRGMVTPGAVRSAHTPLTARELQVMELVERGLKNKDIAESLGIRTGTVKIHLKHIFEKTGIRGRYGLALTGLKEKGLLSAPGLEIAS